MSAQARNSAPRPPCPRARAQPRSSPKVLKPASSSPDLFIRFCLPARRLPDRSRLFLLRRVLRRVPAIAERIDEAALGTGPVLRVAIIGLHRVLFRLPEALHTVFAGLVMQLVMKSEAFAAIPGEALTLIAFGCLHDHEVMAERIAVGVGQAEIDLIHIVHVPEA